MKAGAIGRLGDVTKLLQTQRRVAYAEFCLSGSLSPFSEEPARLEVRGYHPWEIFEITRVAIDVQKLPPPSSEKCDESVG